jgi:hypothetical protein
LYLFKDLVGAAMAPSMHRLAGINEIYLGGVLTPLVRSSKKKNMHMRVGRQIETHEGVMDTKFSEI